MEFVGIDYGMLLLIDAVKKRAIQDGQLRDFKVVWLKGNRAILKEFMKTYRLTDKKGNLK